MGAGETRRVHWFGDVEELDSEAAGSGRRRQCLEVLQLQFGGGGAGVEGR